MVRKYFMDLSVVVLSWNSASYIERCLRCLVGSLTGSGLAFEVLVVDNGSDDPTPRVLEGLVLEFPNQLIVQYLQKNLGTTVSRNIALKRAKGRSICVMDCDVEVTAGVMEKLIRELEQDTSAGLVVPKVLYPNGRVQKSCDRFPTLSHKVHRFFCLRSMESQEALAQEGRKEKVTVDYAISAFWLFRCDLLQSVGLLDERIFYSPEDVDFCLRVWKAGYRIVYVPSVSVTHHTQELSRGWKINRFKLSHVKGLLYLFAKHRYFFRIPEFKVVVPCRSEEAP